MRLRVRACAVCRTDLHVVDGELPPVRPCVVPGHEIVGTIEAVGEAVERFRPGDRLGVPWLGWTCGACRFCRTGRENLCEQARSTGYSLDGGHAGHVLADARFCFPLPDSHGDAEAAPLLCAGLIGHRALHMAVDRGGTVVCAGIHMSDIPAFPYAILWQERRLVSVANLTRRDAEEFLALAPRVPVRTAMETLPLAEANEALRRLRAGEVSGALVLLP